MADPSKQNERTKEGATGDIAVIDGEREVYIFKSGEPGKATSTHYVDGALNSIAQSSYVLHVFDGKLTIKALGAAGEIEIVGNKDISVTSNDGNITVNTGGTGNITINSSGGNVAVSAKGNVNIENTNNIVVKAKTQVNITAETDTINVTAAKDVNINANDGNVVIKGDRILMNS